MKLEFSNRFPTNTPKSNFMKIRLMGAELFHAHEQTDKQTWRTLKGSITLCVYQYVDYWVRQTQLDKVL
jgi:hypothetical protein